MRPAHLAPFLHVLQDAARRVLIRLACIHRAPPASRNWLVYSFILSGQTSEQARGCRSAVGNGPADFSYGGAAAPRRPDEQIRILEAIAGRGALPRGPTECMGRRGRAQPGLSSTPADRARPRGVRVRTGRATVFLRITPEPAVPKDCQPERAAPRVDPWHRGPLGPQ